MTSWPTRPLHLLAEFQSGNTPGKINADYWSGDFPWVSPKDMKEQVILNTQDHLSDEAAKKIAAIARKDSVLVVVRSGILAHTLPLAIAGRDVAFNQDLKSIRVTSTEVLPAYIYRFLQSRSATILSSGIKRGATVHSLQAGFLEGLSVLVPPLPEQERIVAFLDEADALRKLRAQADQRTADLIPALFHDMFGDPATNPMGWPTYSAGELMTKCEYGTSQKAGDDGLGVPILRMGNVTVSGDIDVTSLKTVEIADPELSKYKLKVGDVLFNRTNSRELVGKTGMWDGRFEAVAASYFIRLRFDPACEGPEHFTTFMNLPFMKRQLHSMARGAVGQANINAKELQSISIPVPPLPLQEEFAVLTLQVRALRDKSLSAGRSTDAAFDAILHRSFSED